MAIREQTSSQGKPASKQCGIKRGRIKFPNNCYYEYQGPLLGEQLTPVTEAGTIEVKANSTRFIDEGISTMHGNVTIKQGDQLIEAEQAKYDSNKQTIDVSKGFNYQEPGLIIAGDTAHMSLNQNNLKAKNLEYLVEQVKGQGTAKSVQINEDKAVMLNDAFFTTCQPDDNTWKLTAKSINIYPKKGYAEAKHCTLKIKGIPVAYTPYYAFPLNNQRKTGLLLPSFGHSDESGTEFALPFYWNIAPNYDTTITPRYLSKRGLQLQTEFRFLTKKTEGQLNVEFLPDDNEDGDDRLLVKAENTTRFNHHWLGFIDFQYVSDNDYFEDLDDNLDLSGLTHLNKEAYVSYQDDYYTFTTRVQDYKNIDPTILAVNEPFARLPQLLFTSHHEELLGWFDFNSRAQFDYFDRDDTGNLRTDAATRFDVKPTVSMPLRKTYGHIIPSFSYQYTYYDLHKRAANAKNNDSRTIPIYSIDSQLNFERTSSWFNGSIQTLEPRIYYLYKPKRHQNKLPNFDSTEYTFSNYQLFRDNRFSGIDRISDAHLVSTSISTRFLSARSGKQLLKASLGQTFHFKEPEVGIFADNPSRDNSSPLIGSLQMNLFDNFEAYNTSEWDYENDDLARNAAGILYRSDSQHIVNLFHHYRKDRHQQIEASFVLPLGNIFSLFGHYQYDLHEGNLLEYFYGIEYNSCCWSLRLLSRRQIDKDDQLTRQEEYDQAYMLQFELKGLTGIGENIDSILEKKIRGYKADFNQYQISNRYE